MQYGELVTKVAEVTGVEEKAIRAVFTATGAVADLALKGGDDIHIPPLGKFKIMTRQARPGHNPRTGEKITIAASQTIKFSASKQFREGVN